MTQVPAGFVGLALVDMGHSQIKMRVRESWLEMYSRPETGRGARQIAFCQQDQSEVHMDRSLSGVHAKKLPI